MVKFDKEGFFIAWGLAIVFIGIGILIIWATKTAPDGNSQTMALSTTQRVVRLLPQSTKETLAFVVGALFVLFGFFCVFLGIRTVLSYFRDKFRQS